MLLTGIADGRIHSMGSFVLISVDSQSFGLFARRGFVRKGLKFDLEDYNENSIFCSLFKQLRCKIILDSLIIPLKPPLQSTDTLCPKRSFHPENSSENKQKV